ncbi:MAG: DNA polymerase III subunit gamma/tau [Sheuella sp.]|nr:DNA polymerase III subunit gamma/tau [Sheuella sp.]
MTYLVLARKWRPRTFETLVGQDHVVRALSHALTTQRLHHAWLFTGTRGVGKTTLSRILAKALNCETGITATPCGVCQACTSIDEGRFVDYLELDAASNRGVDEMTQLLEQAVYSPSVGRFKVYMIDEVHMLTGHAFNAMLKTLEEPPAHVKFILATTDPQKIPVTVLSRCLQFNLKQMPGESIVGHLENVLGHEQIPFEVPALRLLGQAASGSMRDALSLTDQAIAYSAGNLTEESVRGMLGTIDQRHLIRLLDSLQSGRAAAVLEIADELSTRGLSYRAALADLAVLLSRIAIIQRVAQAVDESDPLMQDIIRLAQTMHPDAVQLFYTVAVHSRSELAIAPDEYAGFVMACLRMLSLLAGSGAGNQPFSLALPSSVATPGATLGATPAATPAATSVVPPAVTPPVNVVAAPAQQIAVVEPVAAAPVASVAQQVPQKQATPPWDDVPETPKDTQKITTRAPALVAQISAQAQAEVEQQAEPEADQEPQDEYALGADSDGDSSFGSSMPPHLDEEIPPEEGYAAPAPAKSLSEIIVLPEPWASFSSKLPLSGMASQLARQSECAEVSGRVLTLRVPTKALTEGMHADRLRTVLSEYFGFAVQLKFEIAATQGQSAHAIDVAAQIVRQEVAEQSVQNDPFVQALVKDFGAQVVPGSIRPGASL